MKRTRRVVEYIGQIVLVVGVMAGALIYVHDANQATADLNAKRKSHLEQLQKEWQKEATANAYAQADADMKVQAKKMARGHDCHAQPVKGEFPAFILAHKNAGTKVVRITFDQAMKKNSGYWLDSFCYVR